MYICCSLAAAQPALLDGDILKEIRQALDRQERNSSGYVEDRVRDCAGSMFGYSTMWRNVYMTSLFYRIPTNALMKTL